MKNYRINFGILPIKLTDQHLIAEAKLICRIVESVKKRITLNNTFSDIPKNFNIGRNHFKFFYNKLEYLHSRFNALKTEAITRHLAKEMPSEPVFEMEDVVLDHNFLHQCYHPIAKVAEEDMFVAKFMLTEQLQLSKENLKYCGNKLNKKEALALLD